MMGNVQDFTLQDKDNRTDSSVHDIRPVSARQRHVILDALRGFALLGIVMANLPEFSLYTFLDNDAVASFATAGVDLITRYFLAIFIDGKFYTIFSLLFGIGFSIIIANVRSRGGNGYRVFYRRMALLFLIGAAHLLLLWSGDILMLYAAVGMLLPLFSRCSDKGLLLWATTFLFLPVVVDFICQICGVSLSEGLVKFQWLLCDKYGITPDNFAYWLRDANNYDDMFRFLLQGAVVRMQEFVDANRYFKVLGLFLIGFYIGRNRLYASITLHRKALRNVALTGIAVGLPLSAVYAWSSINAHPWGLGVHSLLYFTSVYLLSFGYISTIALLYMHSRNNILWKMFALPGKMALTNYIGQSIAGIIIFYGIGFGLGASMGLFYTELIAVGIYIMEVAISALWLRFCNYGPLEWIWRCLTYGRFFPLLKP